MYLHKEEVWKDLNGIGKGGYSAFIYKQRKGMTCHRSKVQIIDSTSKGNNKMNSVYFV